MDRVGAPCRPGDTPLGGVFHQGKSEAGGNLFYYQTRRTKETEIAGRDVRDRFAQGVGRESIRRMIINRIWKK